MQPKKWKTAMLGLQFQALLTDKIQYIKWRTFHIHGPLYMTLFTEFEKCLNEMNQEMLSLVLL